jgi:PAS domain S-box-containing protein
MIFLPFLHFFCFSAGVLLAIYIFHRDTRSSLNRTLSVLLLCYALWNFGDIIVHNPDRTITKGTVEIMQFIASFGWVGLSMAILCFALAFSKRIKLLKKKWFLFGVFLLPLVFIYKQFTNCLTINPIRKSYGWSVEWSDTIWPSLFYVYFTLFTLLALMLIYFYGRKTKIVNEKKQARIIVISLIISLFAGTLLDIVMQNLNIYTIPPIANLLVFIFVIGVLYAMYKYRFLTITPTIAAENIISAMDEILILLDPEGNILSVNNTALVTLNFEQKELESKLFTFLFKEESLKKKLLEKIMEVETVSNHEGSFITKNGRIIPIIYSISPIKDNEGTVLGHVFISRDISAYKQIEEELTRSKEKAEGSDRLKTAFLANMSHEIRTPMNGILGFADLLKNPDLKNDKQQMYIEIIEKSGHRMLNIINDIIDISKIESGLMKINIEVSDINEQLEYIYTFFKPEVESRGLEFSFIYPLPAINARIITDREKVFAILTNLVKNAIKFTREGSIEFGYVLENNNKPGELCFYIKDTGIGISKEMQKAVFERFLQADISNKMAQSGAGLGLSISKAYVEMLGGRIWLESDEGIGSTFYFTLPYNTESEEIIEIENEILYEKTDNKTKPLKILISEDDDISKMLILLSLEKFRKEIIEARTGIEAVEICRSNPDIDLILMDIQMPVLNGYEATRQIRQFNKNVVIIAHTAYGLASDRENAISSGCNDYISKPIDRKLLIQLIKKHLFKEVVV